MAEPKTAPELLPFAQHARLVTQSMRGAFSDLLRSVGADPHAPQQMCRHLGLNKNLAWKISKIIQADDPAVVLQQMPGTPGARIFLRTVESAGAEPERLDAVRRAIEDYEQLIEIHAGDRTTLEMLGSELSTSGNVQRDEHYRKMLYQGAAYVWGVQARVFVKLGIVGPSETDGCLDCGFLNGLIDLRCLRSDVCWPIAVRHAFNDDGSAFPTHVPEPVDPAFSEEEDPPYIGDLCSQPLPQTRRVQSSGIIGYELVEGPVGNTGARTCVLGTLHRGVPYYATPENKFGSHSVFCDTPTELLVSDMFIHQKYAFAIPPEVSLVGGLNQTLRQSREVLPLNEPMRDLGPDPLAVATPDVPRYREMVRVMFERTGWNPKEFRGFRVKIAYPACPATLRYRYALPDQQG